MNSIKMKMQRHFFPVILLLVFFLTPGWRYLEKYETKNPIERMELSALDELMKSREGPNLIAVMAAWCGPCVKELPALNRLYEKYKQQGLKMIGITLDLEGPSDMQPIVDKLKIEFPIYWVGEKAIDHYEVDAVPMLFVIRNGKIADRIPGKRSEAYLEEKIKDICNR